MRRSVIWTLATIAAGLALVGVVAVGWLVNDSADLKYAAYETVFNARFHRYDDVIREVARKQGVDPMLIKAVIWRESRFRPDKQGMDGERGLMQLTDAAASEWAASAKVEGFTPEQMFDPRTNIEAGSWLLARALKRYQGKDDPLPFALAEYNAGRSRVRRWAGKSPSEPDVTSHEMQANIDIPSTKNYVASVQSRLRFYQSRDGL